MEQDKKEQEIDLKDNKSIINNIINVIQSSSSDKLLIVAGIALLFLASFGKIGSWVDIKKPEERIATGLFGLTLVGAGIFMERASDTKSRQNSKKSEYQGGEELAIFGYLFVEVDEKEEVLINTKSIIEECDLPIFKKIKTDNIEIEDAIDQAISETISYMGINRKKFLEAGISKPIYYKLYKSFEKNREAEALPYVFFKVKLNNKIHGSATLWDSFKWKNKLSDISRKWENGEISSSHESIHSVSIFQAITSNFYYETLNFKFLECIDALVFTKDVDGGIKFLLIKRSVSNESIVWEYPKGGIYYHETLLEGALREIHEETRLNIEKLKYCANLGCQTVDVTDRGKYYNTLRVHGLVFFYTGNKSDIYLDHDHSEFKWVSFNEAKDLIKGSEWLSSYAPEFFDRFKNKEDEILNKAGYSVSAVQSN